MIRALVALGAVVSLCAACGTSGGGEAGGEAADPAEWVESVCTSLTGWRNDLQASTEEIQQSAPDLSNPEQAQSLLTTFLEDAVTRLAFAPAGIHAFDARGNRADPQVFHQLLEQGSRAFGFHFHAAVLSIAHPAR